MTKPLKILEGSRWLTLDEFLADIKSTLQDNEQADIKYTDWVLIAHKGTDAARRYSQDGQDYDTLIGRVARVQHQLLREANDEE